MSRVRLVTVVLGVCGAIGVGGTFAADDLPSRAPGLWELVKNVVDDPRPLPAMRQCTDAATDRMLGGNAFLANYDPCSSIKVVRDGERWKIESVCESLAGEMRTTTVLSGDFKSSYKMEQTAVIEGETVKQTVTARRVGACAAGQKPGAIYINNMGFDLTKPAAE